MRTSTLRLVLVAAAFVARPAAALADAAASADMTNLTFRLVDLDPSDGITPWVMFPASQSLDEFGKNMPSAQADVYSLTAQSLAFRYAPLPFGAISASNTLAGATSTASYAGDPQDAGGATLHAAGSAAGGGPGQFSRATGSGNISFYAAPGTFVLSPETELVMSTNAATSAWTTTSTGDGGPDQANARAYLQLSGIDPGQPSSGQIMASFADPFDGLPAESDSGTLTVSFSNTLASSTDGYYYAFVSIDAQSGTAPVLPPPVPEPEAIELMLGGIGLAALLRVRRRDGTADARRARRTDPA